MERKDMDLFDLLEDYCDQEKIHQGFEGERGFKSLCEIVKVLGYTSWNSYDTNPAAQLQAFFEDNPGALQAVFQWITEQNIPEWRESVENNLDAKDLDEPE